MSWLADKLFEKIHAGETGVAKRVISEVKHYIDDESLRNLKQNVAGRALEWQSKVVSVDDLRTSLHPLTVMKRLEAMGIDDLKIVTAESARALGGIDDPVPDSPENSPPTESPPSKEAELERTRGKGRGAEIRGSGDGGGGGDGGDGGRRHRRRLLWWDRPPGKTVVDYEPADKSGSSTKAPQKYGPVVSDDETGETADSDRTRKRGGRNRSTATEIREEAAEESDGPDKSSGRSSSGAGSKASKSGKSLLRKGDDLVRKLGRAARPIDIIITYGSIAEAHATAEDLEKPPLPSEPQASPDDSRDEIIDAHVEWAVKRGARTRYEILKQHLPGQGSFVGDVVNTVITEPIMGTIGGTHGKKADISGRIRSEEEAVKSRIIEAIGQQGVDLTEEEKAEIRSVIEKVYRQVEDDVMEAL